MIQIFSVNSIQNAAPKLGGETEFHFLDRSSRPEIDRVRAMVQQLAEEYPKAEISELVQRIRSGDDQNFHSSTFELLVYSILRRLGYSLLPHPPLDNGSNKRPDFLVTAPDGSQFYLEAVLASEENGSLAGKQRMIATTLDAISKSRHDSFRVGFTHSGLPTTQPPTKKLMSNIFNWLNALDPDAIWAKTSSKGGLSDEYLYCEHEDWKIRFDAQAINPERRGKSRSMLGITSRGLPIVDSSKPIRDAVTFKSSRYGVLDKPYLIAVNFNTPFLHQEDEKQALFGSDFVTVSKDDSEHPQLKAGRRADGAWHESNGTRVSGAWIFNDLNIYSLAERRSTVYFNPWAKKPLSESLKQFPHATVTNDLIRWKAGIGIQEIFDLPAGWPDGPSQ